MPRPKGSKNKPKVPGKLIVAPKDPGKNTLPAAPDNVDVLDDLHSVIMEGTVEVPAKQDILLVERMGAHMMTAVEICAILNISRSRFDASLAFQAAHQRGLELGKGRIRRLQWQHAARDTAMLIWLGKQFLGQVDKIETKGDDGGKDAARQAFEDKLKSIIDVTPTGQADSVPDPGRDGGSELLLAPVGEGQPDCPNEARVVEPSVNAEARP